MQTVFGVLCSHWKSKPLQLLEKGSFRRVQVALPMKGSGKPPEPLQNKLVNSLTTEVRILNVTICTCLYHHNQEKRDDETQSNHKQECRQHSCNTLKRCKWQSLTNSPIYFRLKVRIKDKGKREYTLLNAFHCSVLQDTIILLLSMTLLIFFLDKSVNGKKTLYFLVVLAAF